ncbi:hypothetical protein BMR10_15065, partial [Methylococcaceae bacterium CS4]
MRWRYFLSDCASLLADYAVVEKQLEHETSDAKYFLDENYQDILENFDPNVVKECARNNFLKQPSLNNEISPLN